MRTPESSRSFTRRVTHDEGFAFPAKYSNIFCSSPERRSRFSSSSPRTLSDYPTAIGSAIFYSVQIFVLSIEWVCMYGASIQIPCVGRTALYIGHTSNSPQNLYIEMWDGCWRCHSLGTSGCASAIGIAWESSNACGASLSTSSDDPGMMSYCVLRIMTEMAWNSPSDMLFPWRVLFFVYKKVCQIL